MIKAYPRYKPSNIEWIGEIPEHWGTKRFKFLFDYLKGRNPKDLVPKKMSGNFYPYLSMEYLRGKETEIQYAEVSNDFILVNENDLLLLWDGSNAGEFILGKEGILSSTMVKIIIISDNDKNFFFYLSKAIERILKDQTKGMGIPHVEAQTLYNFLVPIMPLYEQQSISRYLDDRTQKIDTLIENKQKLIELLKEERIAIINQAVTKGLSPDAPMKESGIEWLGEIPAHWEIKRMKYVAEIKSSNVDKKSYDNEIKVLLCNYLDVYKNEFIDNSFSFMEATANENEIAKFVVKKGDVLVTKDSETPDDIANPAYIKEDLINTICGYHLAQIRADQIELIGEYLFRLFQSKKFNSHFEVSANGVTRFGLSIDSFKGVSIPLPPIEEQTQIVKYIETLTQKIDTTISKIEKEIELLQEYHTALISEVVTGTIDVRDEILT